MDTKPDDPDIDVRLMADEVANYWRGRTFVPYRELVSRLIDIAAHADGATATDAALAHRTLSGVRRDMILFLLGMDRPGIRFSGYLSGTVLAALAVVLAVKEIPTDLSIGCGWAAVAALFLCCLAGITQAMAERLRGSILPQLDDARERLWHRFRADEARTEVNIDRDSKHEDGSTIHYNQRLYGQEARNYDLSPDTSQVTASYRTKPRIIGANGSSTAVGRRIDDAPLSPTAPGDGSSTSSTDSTDDDSEPVRRMQK